MSAADYDPYGKAPDPLMEEAQRVAAEMRAGRVTVRWTAHDAVKAAQRIKAFPGWERLPQPVRSEVDTILYILGQVLYGPEVGSADAGRFDRVHQNPDGSFQHYYRGQPVSGPAAPQVTPEKPKE